MGRGSGPPHLENHNAIGSLTNTGPDPLDNHEGTKPALNNAGQLSATSETPFEWRLAGGP